LGSQGSTKEPIELKVKQERKGGNLGKRLDAGEKKFGRRFDDYRMIKGHTVEIKRDKSGGEAKKKKCGLRSLSNWGGMVKKVSRAVERKRSDTAGRYSGKKGKGNRRKGCCWGFLVKAQV